MRLLLGLAPRLRPLPPPCSRFHSAARLRAAAETKRRARGVLRVVRGEGGVLQRAARAAGAVVLAGGGRAPYEEQAGRR